MAEYAIPAQTESLRVIDKNGHVWTRSAYSEWWHSRFNGSSHSVPWADLLRGSGPVRDAPQKPDLATIRDLILTETSVSFSVDNLASKIVNLYNEWSKYDRP